MPFPSSLQWVGLGLETTRATPVAPTFFIPVKGPQYTPNITELADMGLRGSMVTEYDQIAGLRHDMFDFTCDVYADTFPTLLRACLGSPDTVTGSVAPYTHVIGLLNNANSGQPPSYTISYFDGDEMWQLPAGQCDSVGLKFNAAGLLEATVKFFSNPAAVVTAVTPSFSTVEAIPSWDCVVTLGGTAITKTMDGSIDLKRNVKPIEAITGTQAPYRLWAGPLDTTGALSLVHESDTGEIDNYLNNSKVSLDVKFTDLASNSIELHSSNVAFKTGKPNGSKDWMEYDTEMVCLPNASDAVAGGVSPIKTTTVNQQLAAY